MSILKQWWLSAYRWLGGNIKHKFPLVTEESEELGEIFLPVAPVSLWLPKTKEWVEFQFIIDTGATATILPSSLANEFGVDLKKSPSIKMAGIEGTGVKAWLAEIRMRIDNKGFSSRCLLVDNPQSPFLLGRADVMENVFSLQIDSLNHEIILIEN